MDFIPAQLLNNIGAVSVLLFVTWMIFTGRLVTRREAEAMQREIDAQRAALILKDSTIAEFREPIQTNNALLQALLDVSRQQHRQESGR